MAHPDTLRIATVNVNGVRAAYRKGMATWLEAADADIVALQEVRAELSDLTALVGDGWHVLHDAATAKGRAGVAILSRTPAVASRVGLTQTEESLALPDAVELDTTGRWLEADFEFAGTPLTVVSAYMHSGEVGTPRQVQKYLMLDAVAEHLPELAAAHPLTVVVGDLNVGHTKLDIKNWRGNVKRAGFLPEERAYFDRFFGELGWRDVGREFAGEVDGPYTWWSNRGQAFDNDTGWRIDYQMATPALAERVADYRVVRAASYAERWTDHSPVIVDYRL